MEFDSTYQVVLDDEHYPGKTVVIVEEPGCMTMRWQFFQRRDALRKARAERKRLQESFPRQRKAPKPEPRLH